ncbi:MAG TPA: hypothetical protein PLM56_09470 [Cyclobacteriaceae bacterium]|nr:hypothetical protein [Cyclobacteriaceae bacterium]HRF33718.1 hypothetical protein [Cyclobacteriaceae bacterium]
MKAKETNTKSSGEQVAEHLMYLINRGIDAQARRAQKEARFRQSLGIRLQAPKKESGK